MKGPTTGTKEAEERVARGAAFAKMERDHRLFDARYDGWSPWRVMRNALHRRTMALPIAMQARSDLKRGLRALANSARLLATITLGRRRSIVVKTARSGLRMSAGDGFRDIYFDGVLQRGHTYFKLEQDNSPDFAYQARHALFPSDLDPAVFTFWGRILGRIRPADAMAFSTRVSELLANECGTVVTPDWILMRVSTVYWQARLYGLLLRRLRPVAVLVSDTGEYALRLACLRQGVRFIELQHGIFDASHPDAIPVWVEGEAGELLLPDMLACRGQYWIEQLRGTRQGRDHAVAVGNELIDITRSQGGRRHPSAEDRLVVTSQGMDSRKLADWLVQLVQGAPEDRTWTMSIKLHPTYDMDNHEFDALGNDPRIRVIPGAQPPNVYDLLSDADWHLSIASACHFDAASLDVPSVVIPLSGHERILPAVDGRTILLAARPQDFWTIAAAQTDHPDDGARYSEPCFVDNIERLIASASTSSKFAGMSIGGTR